MKLLVDFALVLLCDREFCRYVCAVLLIDAVAVELHSTFPEFREFQLFCPGFLLWQRISIALYHVCNDGQGLIKMFIKLAIVYKRFCNIRKNSLLALLSGVCFLC